MAQAQVTHFMFCQCPRDTSSQLRERKGGGVTGGKIYAVPQKWEGDIKPATD